MCGLFGWQVNKTIMERGDMVVLATMLAAGAEHRGNESWGVILVDGDTPPAIIKNTGSIKQSCRIPSIVAPQVIGHTRKATTGAITVQNAHPFVHKNIIGSHNGFIFDHEQLNTEYHRDFQVDSQHLIAHIAEGLSLTDLSGMGTTSYINAENPHAVYLGRGQNSDLAVFGIGEDHEHPDGIIWGSVAHWVKDAIEMAHLGPIFTVHTNVRQLYRVNNCDIEEVAEFPLGQGRSRSRAIQLADTREIGLYRNSGVRSYSPRSHFDEYDKRKASYKSLESVSKDEVEALPEGLKKNPQERDLSSREEEKTPDTTVQCDGCNDWGPLVASFEADAGGILKHSAIDSMLCFTCTLHWGQETGVTMPPVKAPLLSVYQKP